MVFGPDAEIRVWLKNSKLEISIHFLELIDALHSKDFHIQDSLSKGCLLSSIASVVHLHFLTYKNVVMCY